MKPKKKKGINKLKFVAKRCWLHIEIDSKKEKKGEEEMGKQHHRMNRPEVWQHPGRIFAL